MDKLEPCPITQAMRDNAKAIWLEYLDKPRAEIMDLLIEVYECWKALDPTLRTPAKHQAE